MQLYVLSNMIFFFFLLNHVTWNFFGSCFDPPYVQILVPSLPTPTSNECDLHWFFVLFFILFYSFLRMIKVSANVRLCLSTNRSQNYHFTLFFIFYKTISLFWCLHLSLMWFIKLDDVWSLNHTFALNSRSFL